MNKHSNYTTAHGLTIISFFIYAIAVGVFGYMGYQICNLTIPNEPPTTELISYPTLTMGIISSAVATLAVVFAWVAIGYNKTQTIITYFTVTILGWVLLLAFNTVVFLLHNFLIVNPAML